MRLCVNNYVISKTMSKLIHFAAKRNIAFAGSVLTYSALLLSMLLLLAHTIW